MFKASLECKSQKCQRFVGSSGLFDFRVDNNDFETALIAARCGVDDVVTKDADSKKWSVIAASARIRC